MPTALQYRERCFFSKDFKAEADWNCEFGLTKELMFQHKLWIDLTIQIVEIFEKITSIFQSVSQCYELKA